MAKLLDCMRSDTWMLSAAKLVQGRIQVLGSNSRFFIFIFSLLHHSGFKTVSLQTNIEALKCHPSFILMAVTGFKNVGTEFLSYLQFYGCLTT